MASYRLIDGTNQAKAISINENTLKDMDAASTAGKLPSSHQEISQ